MKESSPNIFPHRHWAAICYTDCYIVSEDIKSSILIDISLESSLARKMNNINIIIIINKQRREKQVGGCRKEREMSPRYNMRSFRSHRETTYSQDQWAVHGPDTRYRGREWRKKKKKKRSFSMMSQPVVAHQFFWIAGPDNERWSMSLDRWQRNTSDDKSLTLTDR